MNNYPITEQIDSMLDELEADLVQAIQDCDANLKEKN